MGASKTPGGGAGPETPRVPTYSVRFESHDDFLVAYADHLRHGRVELPLPSTIAPGQAVRLRVHLPDRAVLYLTGSTTSPSPGVADGISVIELDGLSAAQRQALESCIDTVVGRGREPSGGGAPVVEGPAISLLLVDDQVSQRIELGDALRARGLRVRVAENGLLALSAALKRTPDVILTDVEMPQMDGWSLLRSIRQRKRLLHVPVVFLTRLEDEFSRLRGYRMGVDDYLPKSMPPDEIVARLQGVLARRRRMPAISGQGLRGDLEHVRLGSLLSFIEAERRSGALHIRNGSDRAVLHIRGGALTDVENLGRYAHPHDRVFELLDWSFGQFEFRGEDEESIPDEGATPISYLLMEHARREDEAGVKP